MPEFLMLRSILILLLLVFPFMGAFPSFANGNSGDEFLAIDVLDDSCTSSPQKSLDNSGRATATLRCEPLPVALDLRFMDDDFNSLSYDLPVALDLDWESGEP